MAPIAALGGCSCCSGLVCRYSGELTDVRAAAVSWAVTATRWRMFVLQRSHRPLQRRIGGCSCCNGLIGRYSGGLADTRVATVSQIVTAAEWRMLVLQRSLRSLQRRIGGFSCCSGLACRYSVEMAEARAAAVSHAVTAAKWRRHVPQRSPRSLQQKKKMPPGHPLMHAFSLIEPNVHGDDQSNQRKDGQPQVEKALPLILLEESQDS